MFSIWTKPLLLFVVISALVCVATSQSCASHSNGCSIPYNLPYLFKAKFTPGCDRHDICYACATIYGKKRSDCDLMLFSIANGVCRSLKKRLISSTVTTLERDFCKGVSLSYYEAVKYFGSSHFETHSPAWCSQSWVRSCLP